MEAELLIGSWKGSHLAASIISEHSIFFSVRNGKELGVWETWEGLIYYCIRWRWIWSVSNLSHGINNFLKYHSFLVVWRAKKTRWQALKCSHNWVLDTWLKRKHRRSNSELCSIRIEIMYWGWNGGVKTRWPYVLVMLWNSCNQVSWANKQEREMW